MVQSALAVPYPTAYYDRVFPHPSSSTSYSRNNAMSFPSQDCVDMRSSRKLSMGGSAIRLLCWLLLRLSRCPEAADLQHIPNRTHVNSSRCSRTHVMQHSRALMCLCQSSRFSKLPAVLVVAAIYAYEPILWTVRAAAGASFVARIGGSWLGGVGGCFRET